MAKVAQANLGSLPGQSPREARRQGASTKTIPIVTALVACVVLVYVGHAAEVAVPATAPSSGPVPVTAIDLPVDVVVGDRYVVPDLPPSVVDSLPESERRDDQYLSERIALADLVIDERILAAEDRANDYARDLPGFAEVLRADGFRQDADGIWFYDLYTSWMRFPLNR